MRVSRLVVGALVALVVGGVVAVGAVTADAGRCNLWNSSITVVLDGECYYVPAGEAIEDSVDVVGGTLNGGGGDDIVNAMYGGTFNGGGGTDRVNVLSGGTFNGGNGDDVVRFMNDGTFNGGGGDDSITGLMYGGTFNGGPGADEIAGMCNGTFAGGAGNDTVWTWANGIVWSATIEDDGLACG